MLRVVRLTLVLQITSVRDALNISPANTFRRGLREHGKSGKLDVSLEGIAPRTTPATSQGKSVSVQGRTDIAARGALRPTARQQTAMMFFFTVFMAGTSFECSCTCFQPHPVDTQKVDDCNSVNNCLDTQVPFIVGGIHVPLVVQKVVEFLQVQFIHAWMNVPVGVPHVQHNHGGHVHCLVTGHRLKLSMCYLLCKNK